MAKYFINLSIVNYYTVKTKKEPTLNSVTIMLFELDAKNFSSASYFPPPTT